jgi:hypothetical protein
MTTMTFTTYQSKVTHRAASKATVVHNETVANAPTFTDEQFVESFGTKVAGWDITENRKEAQFSLRQGEYDYTTVVAIIQS